MKRSRTVLIFVIPGLISLLGSFTLSASAQSPQPGTIITIAGTGQTGFSGDGGPATQAQLYAPTALTLDRAGNLFIVARREVRELRLDGTITTVAGSPSASLNVDGVAATQAEIDPLGSVAVDATGNLFIADARNGLIRRVGLDNVIRTVALIGDYPTGVSLDAMGNLLTPVTPWQNLVRKISPDGTIVTVAGAGVGGYIGDGGPATQARLHDPRHVTVDALGNLFIADRGNQRIRKVGLDGTISTVAGSSDTKDGALGSLLGGYWGDGGPATQAGLNSPSDVAVDSAGNLFIADTWNNRVRKVTPDGTITTVAGTGPSGFSGDGGPAALARLASPMGIAVDPAGNLLIADTANHRVRKLFGVAAPGLFNGQPFPR